MPAEIVLDTQTTFVTDPVSPVAGSDFTVTWQEVNVGDEPSGNYQDIFDMDDSGTGDSQSLDCDPLEPNQSVARSLTFNLPAGDYDMNLVLNGQGPNFLGNVRIEDSVFGEGDQ
jgi:hypothetical protein